jgi:hypothetical protein
MSILASPGQLLVAHLFSTGVLADASDPIPEPPISTAGPGTNPIGNITLNDSLPGVGTAKALLGGLLAGCLIMAAAGALLSVGIWAIAHHNSNQNWQGKGKSGALVATGAALALGAINTWMAWSYGIGLHISGGHVVTAS